MTADQYRRKARYYLILAQQINPRQERAAMIDIAAFWIKRAEETEQNQRIAQQQTQTEKESEGERS